MKKLLYIIYASLLIANASFAQIVIKTSPGLSPKDSTGYEGYATRKAIIDTAAAIRGALVDTASALRSTSMGAFVGLGDSTSHSPNNYATYSALADTTVSLKQALADTADSVRGALVDTASALRTAMGSGSINSEAVYIDTLGSPSINTLQDWLRTSQSAGKMYGGDITDNGNGSISVSAGEGFIKISNSDTARTLAFSWDANSSVSLADGEVNYICVDYNGGSPAISTSTSLPSDHSTKIMLGLVYRDGTSLHIVTAGQTTSNFASKVTWKDIEVNGKLQRASGLIISESGERYIHITAGVIYAGFTKVNINVFDSQNAADSLTAYYRNNSGGWVKVTGVHQLDNQYYDDGGGSLASLNNNYKTCRYIYVDANGSVFMVYGQNQYATLGGAIEEGAPSSLPNVVSGVCTLIGKIIVKEGEDNFEKVYSPFEAKVEYGAVTEHNELGDIQGGSADEYYHFTEGEHSELSDWLPHVELSSTGGIDADDDVIAPNITALGDSIDAVGDNVQTLTGYTYNQSFNSEKALGSLYARGAVTFYHTSALDSIYLFGYYNGSVWTWATYPVDSTDGSIGDNIDTKTCGGLFGNRLVELGNSNKFFTLLGVAGIGGPSLASLTINADGTFGSFIDTLNMFYATPYQSEEGGFDLDVVNDSMLVCVGSQYVNTSGYDTVAVKSVKYNSDGTLGDDVADSLLLAGSGLGAVDANTRTECLVRSVPNTNYFIVFATTWLVSFEMNGDGTISPIDTLTGLAVPKIKVKWANVGDKFGVLYAASASPFPLLYYLTFDISPSGMITNVVTDTVGGLCSDVSIAQIYGTDKVILNRAPYHVSDYAVKTLYNNETISSTIDSSVLSTDNYWNKTAIIRIGNTNYFMFYYQVGIGPTKLRTGLFEFAPNAPEQKVNVADSTGHSPNAYATRSALLDSLEGKVSVEDSTGHSPNAYATRSALVDTAGALRDAMRTTAGADTIYPKYIDFHMNDDTTLMYIFGHKSTPYIQYAWVKGYLNSDETTTKLELRARNYDGSNNRTAAVTVQGGNYSVVKVTPGLDVDGDVTADNMLYKADSTGHSTDHYATRSALVDTASALREDVPLSDTLRPKLIYFRDASSSSLLNIRTASPSSTLDYGIVTITGTTSSIDTSTTLEMVVEDYFDEYPLLQTSIATLKITASHRPEGFAKRPHRLEFNGTIIGNELALDNNKSAGSKTWTHSGTSVDTVANTDGGVNSLYFITWSSNPGSPGAVWCETKTDTLIVHTASSVTGTPTYNWIRVEKN